jgi:hypothetical protein
LAPLLQPFDGAPRPRVIDLKDVQEAFASTIGGKQMAYMAQLEMSVPSLRFPHNVKPSLLQAKLKSGSNR